MAETLDGIAPAWREVAHLSALTGISVTVLLTLGVLIYFDPLARKLAIRTAVAVVAAYVLAIYAYHLGSADKQTQWDAQNRRVAAALDRRDVDAAKAALAGEAADASDLKTEASQDQGIVDALKDRDATCHPITADQLR